MSPISKPSLFPGVLESMGGWPLPFLNHNLTVSKWRYLVTSPYRLYSLHLDCAWGMNDMDYTRWHCYLIFWFLIDLHFLAAACSLLFTGKQHSGATWAQPCLRSPCLWNNPEGDWIILFWPHIPGRCSHEVLTLASLACGGWFISVGQALPAYVAFL